MADIFREVDEEVRQDRVQLWLARYWGWLLVVGLLIVAVAGGWRAYEYWTTQNEQISGGEYLDALKLARDGKGAETIAKLDELAKTGTPGYRVLARIRAAAQLGLTDAAGGAKAFDAVAADPSVDPALQDVARLRAAALLLDTLDMKALRQRLEPLADTNSALRNPARELLALAALKANDAASAARFLDAIITDRAATPSARQRAEAFQALARDAKPATQPTAAAPASVTPAPASPQVPSPSPPPAPATP
ncbi:tetratricopeptide repeat protein [Lichenifustis flavocetrariae]|uniref:Tetratricopeptide repeat protein n=1 Tax=Lichenifustis flavocetrariae TaxID=2949735 RepID=A0AA41YZ87_9HYPH|nr:tetratricopeptide repeat protein [Lichenifustis flavocetrariae]MCW6507598.1 tetratricopeptide repeat protein [Lichenifustis flavocetrariae]